MSEIPKCAKCDKLVYPMEELKCLDKIFHKGCFRCDTCNMMLTLRTVCGWKGVPYCRTHYPKEKHTVVLDTPENILAKQNTKMQSMINYHAEYKRNLGKAHIDVGPKTEETAAPAE